MTDGRQAAAEGEGMRFFKRRVDAAASVKTVGDQLADDVLALLAWFEGRRISDDNAVLVMRVAVEYLTADDAKEGESEEPAQ